MYIYIFIYTSIFDHHIYAYIYTYLWTWYSDYIYTQTQDFIGFGPMIDKKTTSCSVPYTVLQVGWTSLVTSRGAIGRGLACEEQYPKALGHTVEELDVSEAGTIKVFTVRMGQSRFKLQSRTFRLHVNVRVHIWYDIYIKSGHNILYNILCM